MPYIIVIVDQPDKGAIIYEWLHGIEAKVLCNKYNITIEYFEALLEEEYLTTVIELFEATDKALWVRATDKTLWVRVEECVKRLQKIDNYMEK